MFDPERQNMDCPHCFLGKVYYDREIGFYCMYCGDQFSTADMEILVEKMAIISSSARKSGRSHKIPATEIREIPSRKTKSEHISIKGNEPDR